MTIRLERRPATDDAILSTVFVDGVFECFGLEHAGFEIPCGRYPVTITRSQRFGRMLPLINGVPGRSGIRIHSGNVPLESTGCVLVGQDHGMTSIGHSRLALQALQSKIAGALARGQDVWIDIGNAPTAPTLNA